MQTKSFSFTASKVINFLLQSDICYSGYTLKSFKGKLKSHLIFKQSLCIKNDPNWLPLNYNIYSDVNIWEIIAYLHILILWAPNHGPHAPLPAHHLFTTLPPQHTPHPHLPPAYICHVSFPTPQATINKSYTPRGTALDLIYLLLYSLC